MPKYEAWKHQEIAKDFALSLPNRAAYLGMDMGTGKTKTTIDILSALAEKKNDAPLITFVACPKSVIATWPMEMEKHCSTPFHVVPLSGDKSVAEKTRIAENQLTSCKLGGNSIFMVVLNYESAWRNPFHYWAQVLMKWDAIVCDEAHRIKSANSKQSRFMGLVAKHSPEAFRLCLSGTPLPHSPLDVWGQYRFLDPRIFGSSYYPFHARYAIMGGYEQKQVIGFKNLDELNEKMHSIMFRVMAEDVLDLPDFKDVFIPVELTAASRRIYKDMKDDLVALVRDEVVTAANGAVKVLKLQQIASGAVKIPANLDRTISSVQSFCDKLGLTGIRVGSKLITPDGLVVFGNEKLDALKDLVEDMDKNEPLVIFTRFKADARRCKDTVEAIRDKPCSQLTGDVDELEQFRSGDTDAIVVNIRSGGAGVDLSRARYAVYFSLGHSLGDYLQSRKRLDRPGQTRKGTYFHIVAKGTIDEAIYRALTKRQNVVEYVLRRLKEGGDAV